MNHNHEKLAPADIPNWLLPAYLVCRKRLDNENRFLHLTMRGLEQLNGPNLLKYIANVTATNTIAIEQAEAMLQSSLDTAKQDAEWVTREAETGFPLVHAHSVVGIWSAVEVFCEDFSIAWLGNVPVAWTAPEIEKLKIPLSMYHRLQVAERPRFVISEVSRSLSTDLRRGVGKLKSLLAVFNLAPSVGQNIQQALHELCQVRNLIVHCGGMADQKFIDECPGFGLKTGDELIITHTLSMWYWRAAFRYVEQTFSKALVAVGLRGCNCPGLDEIKPRPTKQQTESLRENEQ